MELWGARSERGYSLYVQHNQDRQHNKFMLVLKKTKFERVLTCATTNEEAAMVGRAVLNALEFVDTTDIMINKLREINRGES